MIRGNPVADLAGGALRRQRDLSGHPAIVIEHREGVFLTAVPSVLRAFDEPLRVAELDNRRRQEGRQVFGGPSDDLRQLPDIAGILTAQGDAVPVHHVIHVAQLAAPGRRRWSCK